MKTEFIGVSTLIGVAAVLASCDECESQAKSGEPAHQVVTSQVAVGGGRRNMSDLRGIERTIRATPDGERSVTRSHEIRDAIISLAENSGTSYGACLSQIFEDLSLDASDAETKRMAKYLALISWGDEDLLLSVLGAAPPGLLLEQAASIARGASYQTPDGKSRTYDLKKAYGVMPESPARKIIAEALVDRTKRKRGLSAALAVANTLRSDEERKAAAYQLVPAYHSALLEKQPIDSGDIPLLLKMAREAGVEGVLLKSLAQPTE